MKMPADFNKLKVAMTGITLIDEALAVLSKVKIYSVIDNGKSYFIIELDDETKKELASLAEKGIALAKELKGNEVQKRRSCCCHRDAGTGENDMGQVVFIAFEQRIFYYRRQWGIYRIQR